MKLDLNRLKTLYEDLKARYEDLKAHDTLENVIKRSELGLIINKVQDLIIEELQEQVTKLENKNKNETV